MTSTMNDERVLAILQALANGVDPASGAAFPAESPYQRPDTVRALYHAIRALETILSKARSGERRSGPTPPGNSGKPWSPEEDTALATGFDAGQPLEALAAAHGRSRFAIEARLAKLGKVPMPAGVRASGSPAPRAGERPAHYGTARPQSLA
ncbi:MAG: hypothetical protein IT515_04040 [Burkholderiales bacterium]|nr:hypothetical protein [Burkholderiales bacterium]